MNRLVIGCVLAASTVALADSPVARKPAFDPFAFPHGVPRTVTHDGYRGLGADSIAPEDVAKYAPAALDPSVSRHIQAMLDVRPASGGALTSTGARMYFTWRVTGTPQVWRQDGPNKFPIQLTAGEDATTIAGLAPDDSYLVVSRDVGGEENPGLYILAPDGGPLRLIQHDKKVRTSLAFISDDAKTIYYSANDRDPASYAIYSYDVAAGTKQLVFDKPGLWQVADHRDDTWLLVNNLGEQHVEVFEYDAKTKLLQPLLGQNETEDYQVQYGAKRGQVLVRSNKPSDFMRLYALEGGKLTPISPDVKFDVSTFGIDHQRTHVYVVTDEAGRARTDVLDAKTLKPIAWPKLPPAEIVTPNGGSYNGRFIQLGLSSSNTMATVATIDWQSRRVETWQRPSLPEIDESTFVRAEPDSYPARDGTQIPMFVRRPAKCAATPCPVIVQFHGGPEGEATAAFSPVAQIFVDAGFVVVQPNVRGSLGYGKAYVQADDGPKRLEVITDIEDCATYIRSAWAKNGKAPKIGVNGASYGGYATLMAMTYFAGAYDAGVDVIGMSNLVTFLANTAPYRRILRASEYGDLEKDHDALVKLSPITYVDRVKAPLLVIAGVNDPRVPVGEALQIHDELAKRDIPTGLILFADEGHGTTKRPNEVLRIGHTLAFFQQYLL